MAPSRDRRSVARIVAVCLVVAMLPGATPVGAVDFDADGAHGAVDDGFAVFDGGVGATFDGDASGRIVSSPHEGPLAPLFHQVDEEDEREDEEDEEDDDEEDEEDDDEEDEREDEEDDDGGLLGLLGGGDGDDDDGEPGDGDDREPDQGDDERDRGQEGGPDDQADENVRDSDGSVSGDVDVEEGVGDVGQAEAPTPTPTPTVTTGASEQERFRVGDVSVNRSTVTAGEPVRITATVVNGWSATETRDVHLVMFDETVDVRSVTVPSGDARQVTFVRVIHASGTYEVNVGQASTELTVTAAEGDDSTTWQTGLMGRTEVATPGFTGLAAVLGVLGALLVATVRRRG